MVVASLADSDSELLPLVLQAEIVHPLPPNRRTMTDADLAVRLDARERALGQVELRDALVEAVAAAEIDVGTQLLRVGQRVLDLER